MHRRALLFAVLGGCGGWRGEVDGRPVGGRQAIFDVERVEIPLFGDFDVVALVLTDVSSPCDTLNRLNDAAALPCDESCVAVADIADEIGPTDHWQALLYAVTEAGEVVGNYNWKDAEILGDREFDGQLAWWDLRGADDIAACTAACENGTSVIASDTFDAQSGTLTVDAFEPEVSLDGEIDVGFGGEDAVAGVLHAESCPSLSNL
jgi:hypothetical protein